MILSASNRTFGGRLKQRYQVVIYFHVMCSNLWRMNPLMCCYFNIQRSLECKETERQKTSCRFSFSWCFRLKCLIHIVVACIYIGIYLVHLYVARAPYHLSNSEDTRSSYIWREWIKKFIRSILLFYRTVTELLLLFLLLFALND